jgi:hypothetical protein
MQLQQSSRKKAKLKCGLQGPSGSGKTKSALLIAYGITGNWSTIAVIDTENNSADLYADLGPYKTLSLEPPYTPERYIEGIQICLDAGIEVVIIDSATHEWDNLLDYHSSLTGNSFTNWAKVTPRHEAFVNKILQSNAHFICTIRSKMEYVLAEKNGKQVPEKVGMKGVQRENLEYEFTVVLELDMKHMAKVSKDRTGLFGGKPEFIPTIQTGIALLDWCNQGVEAPHILKMEEMQQLIKACNTTKELNALYHAHPKYQQVLNHEFAARNEQLKNNIVNQSNFSPNGTANVQPN